MFGSYSLCKKNFVLAINSCGHFFPIMIVCTRPLSASWKSKKTHCKSWKSVCTYNNFAGNFPAYLNPIYLCVTMQLRRLKFSNANLLRRYLDIKYIHSVWFNLSWLLSNFHLTRYKREREREGDREEKGVRFMCVFPTIYWYLLPY